MQWVTREHPHTDRIGCPWLIRKFINLTPAIVDVPRDQMLAYAERTGAISFDGSGAKHAHRDGLCSFELLSEGYKLGADPALAFLAKVVHGADVSEDADATPQSWGIEAIARGFQYLGMPDPEELCLELPVYDAPYAWAQEQVATQP